jgi:hypothetical protein
VAIFAAPPLSGAIGENPDDLLLSLSLIYHGDILSPEAATPLHDHESTVH